MSKLKYIGVIGLVNFQDKVSFIWSIAELLRGPYKKEQYGDVILPMAVLRRFDCVLEDTNCTTQIDQLLNDTQT